MYVCMYGCQPYFDTWCGPSANLECRSEMCCMRLAGNAEPKKSPSGHHRTTLSGHIFATKAYIDIKKLLSSNISSTCPHNMVNFWPTSGWDHSGSLGHPSEFQRVSYLGSVTERHSSSGCQPNFVALNRGRHLYSAGRPSRWALAHILVWYILASRYVVCHESISFLELVFIRKLLMHSVW